MTVRPKNSFEQPTISTSAVFLGTGERLPHRPPEDRLEQFPRDEREASFPLLRRIREEASRSREAGQEVSRHADPVLELRVAVIPRRGWWLDLQYPVKLVGEIDEDRPRAHAGSASGALQPG